MPKIKKEVIKTTVFHLELSSPDFHTLLSSLRILKGIHHKRSIAYEEAVRLSEIFEEAWIRDDK